MFVWHGMAPCAPSAVDGRGAADGEPAAGAAGGKPAAGAAGGKPAGFETVGGAAGGADAELAVAVRGADFDWGDHSSPTQPGAASDPAQQQQQQQQKPPRGSSAQRPQRTIGAGQLTGREATGRACYPSLCVPWVEAYLPARQEANNPPASAAPRPPSPGGYHLPVLLALWRPARAGARGRRLPELHAGDGRRRRGGGWRGGAVWGGAGRGGAGRGNFLPLEGRGLGLHCALAPRAGWCAGTVWAPAKKALRETRAKKRRLLWKGVCEEGGTERSGA